MQSNKLNIESYVLDEVTINGQEYSINEVVKTTSKCGSIFIYNDENDENIKICLKVEINPNTSEIDNLTRFQSEYTVQLISSQVVNINGKIKISYIFTKFYSKGDLIDLLTNKPGYLTQDVCIYTMMQMFQVFNQFWSKGYVHGDIKPDNILVDSTSTSDNINDILKDAILVVADLESTNKQDQPQICYTPTYLDPEQKKSGIVTIFNDIYSLGVSFKHLVKFVKDTNLKQQIKQITTNCKQHKLTPDQLKQAIAVLGNNVNKQIFVKCKQCDSEFPTEHGLKIHIGIKHKVNIKIPNLKDIPIPNNINIDTQQILQLLPVQVHKIHQVVNQARSKDKVPISRLNQLLDNKLKPKQNLFQCDKCEGLFGTDRGLKIHIGIKHKQQQI